MGWRNKARWKSKENFQGLRSHQVEEIYRSIMFGSKYSSFWTC